MPSDFVIPTTAALTWSQDGPTTSGAYWFREISDPPALPLLTMVLVSNDGRTIRLAMAGTNDVHTIPMHEFDGQFRFCEFAGPLLGPGEQDEYANRWHKIARAFDNAKGSAAERIVRDLGMWREGYENHHSLQTYVDGAMPSEDEV